MQKLIQRGNVNGLLDERFCQAIGRADIGVSRGKNNPWRLRQAVRGAGQIKAAHARHTNIADQKMKMRLLQMLQSTGTIAGHSYNVTATT